MKVYEYTSNNSGGYWWLKDYDWKALEDAGWDVDWVASKEKVFPGIRLGNEGSDRWLGALATSAKKAFESITDAIEEFEEITGQDYEADGCGCCGRPHSIYEAWQQ